MFTIRVVSHAAPIRARSSNSGARRTKAALSEARSACAVMPLLGSHCCGSRLWLTAVAALVTACGALEPECLQPLERGSCDKLHGRFFYNATSRQCQEFFWLGCAENANNFENREDCEKECQHGPGRRNAICYRRPRRGNCKAIHRRWFFNYRTLMCDRFLWGGCDTNGNNFHNRRDCRVACSLDSPVPESDRLDSGM
ncbi:BPTI/Kunitz domain-containing protein isoform X2 [Dermacentor silvarum]|nr:BPTI/Kunitz domain-containing protein isoform X2 [Dermacentor silvarum]